jgi:Acetyltransferase (GNAT) family
MRYLLAMDPDGCWVALDGKDVIGFAISQNRGALWYLATYGVLPEHQGMGVGRQLMDAVLAHAEARAGIFSSSVHPGATRRYRLAGFSLHPQMRMVGVDGPAGSRSAGGAPPMAPTRCSGVGGRNARQLHHHREPVGSRRGPRSRPRYRARGIHRSPGPARADSLPAERSFLVARLPSSLPAPGLRTAVEVFPKPRRDCGFLQ